MQAFSLILLAVIPAILCYDEKFDKMDVDKIIGDEATFISYVKCMLDKGDCKIEHASEIKELLPEIVETGCGKCTATQRSHLRKTVKAIQEKMPKEFEEFRKKYDPVGDHEETFAVFMVGD